MTQLKPVPTQIFRQFSIGRRRQKQHKRRRHHVVMKTLERRLTGHHTTTGAGRPFDEQDFPTLAGQKCPCHQSIDTAADNQVVDLPQGLRPRCQRHSPDRAAGTAFNF